MPTINSKPTKPVVDRRRYTNRDPKSQSSTYIQKRRHRKIRKLQTHIPTKRHIQNICWNYTKKTSKNTRQTLIKNTIRFQKRQKHGRRNTTSQKSSGTWAGN